MCQSNVRPIPFGLLQEADDYVLPESSAILKYLAQKHHVADHWYPSKYNLLQDIQS